MKSTLFRSVLAFAALACAAASSTFVATVRAIKNLVLDGFKLAVPAVEARRPAVLFVQARAFVLRLAKRQRPEVSGSWRMCPST
jgi:hypothetical protein